MSAALLALLASLAAAPSPCEGERVALLPFETVALPRAEARRLEDAVRRAVEATPGVCLEPRAETVARLRARGESLGACGDAVCRGAQVTALGTRRLVRGVALGVGGRPSVVLAATDTRGQETRTTFEVADPGAASGEAEARARQAVQVLWPRSAESKAEVRRSRVLPTVLLAAGGAALVAGAGFGLASRRSESRLGDGNAGCAGEGGAFRDCISSRLAEGRRQARTANLLLGAGAVLGAGGALLFVWELP